MSDKLEKMRNAIIESYKCHDQYGESCDGDCKDCGANLQVDLFTYEQAIRKEERDKTLNQLTKKNSYKDIPKNELIRKRRIAFELCESNMPKTYREFVMRVLESDELTPTITEEDIRKDEREKVCNELLNRQILIIDDEGNMHTVVRIKHIYELINKELKNENGN